MIHKVNLTECSTRATIHINVKLKQRQAPWPCQRNTHHHIFAGLGDGVFEGRIGPSTRGPTWSGIRTHCWGHFNSHHPAFEISSFIFCRVDNLLNDLQNVTL